MMENKMLKPCPFCGGKATIICCDDEENIRDDYYENNPWSGLGYQIRHSHEENEDCPIARYAEDGAIYIYDTREEAVEAWNRRASDVYRQEVKYAKWELLNKNQSRCSNCGLVRNIETQVGWNFCPNCGAKFNLEEENG